MLSDSTPEFLQIGSTDEFLPPLGIWTTLGGLIMLVTFGAAFALASVIPYNIVVKTAATVRPSGEIRLIQATTEGKVTSIAVKENMVVKKGDIIATIDNTQLQTKKSQLIGNIQQSKLQLVQLNAQIEALNGQIAAEIERSKRTVFAAQAELERTQREHQEKTVAVNSELQEAQANIKIASDELEKARVDLKSAQANMNATEAALKAAVTKYNRYKTIGESGSISINQVEEVQLAVAQQQQAVLSQKAILEGQKQVIEQKQQAVTAAIARYKRVSAAQNPSDAVIVMANQKIAQERAAGEISITRLKQEQKSLLQRKVEIQNQVNSTAKDLQQIETQLQLTVIPAWETGTILKLELRNPGQIVRPGDVIAQIAPNNVPLLVKARVSAEDISKVQVCKAEKVVDCQEGKVLIRVSAYPYPDYGTLKGSVRAITADAITPQNNGSTPVVPYYEVTIEPEKLYLQKGTQQYAIQSGMEVTADIIFKQETVLTFILRKARLLTNL